jgi:hypothetical protein
VIGRTNQPQVHLVDQGRGVERLSRRFMGRVARGQAAVLVVDQRQQLAGGLHIALLGSVQNLGDFAHSGQYMSAGGL